MIRPTVEYIPQESQVLITFPVPFDIKDKDVYMKKALRKVSNAITSHDAHYDPSTGLSAEYSANWKELRVHIASNQGSIFSKTSSPAEVERLIMSYLGLNKELS